MNPNTLRIATRKSPLALWQAEFIKQVLSVLHPELTVTLVPLTTLGDKILDKSLAKIGGKGLFVKELERALLDNQADIAVHSMKDVPVDFPSGLGLALISERDDCRDALVSNHYQNLDELPSGATIGTSSLRRQCQLLALRPDLNVVPLRGNINTRLQKAAELDGIILAAAGLKRMEFDGLIRQTFSIDDMLPAAGQGALGIECRLDDAQTLALIAPLCSEKSQTAVTAERVINQQLEGNCQVPIAAHAYIETSGELHLRALVGTADGKTLITAQASGAIDAPVDLGLTVAEKMIEQGAKELLQKIMHSA